MRKLNLNNIKLKLYIVLILTSCISICYTLNYTIEGWLTTFTCVDIDNDSDMDIIFGVKILSGQDWPATVIMVNNGNGEFSTNYIYHPMGYTSSAKREFVYDMNNDDYVDIISTSFVDSLFSIRIDYNNHGMFDSHSDYLLSFFPIEYDVGDLDGDNDVDIVTTFEREDEILFGIFLNDGNGGLSFDSELDEQFGYLDLVDLNQDGIVELLIFTDDTVKIYEYPNLEDHQTEIVFGNIGFFNYSDFDNDNDIDICKSYFDDTNDIIYITIYENLGNYQFIAHESIINDNQLEYLIDWRKLFVVDFNDDGYPDISYFDGIVYNDGALGFDNLELLQIPMGPVQYFGCFGYSDLNNDDRIDFISSSCDLWGNAYIETWFQNEDGDFIEEAPVEAIETDIVNTDFILSNYPNPFNPETTLKFTNIYCDASGELNLKIFNIKGQCIKEFALENVTGQIGNITWNGTDRQNSPVSSGIYLAVLQQDNRNLASKKMLLLK